MKSIILLFVLCCSVIKIQAQLNLTPPAEGNKYTWVLSQNNNPNISYEKFNHDLPGRLYVIHREKIARQDWICRGIYYLSPRTNIYSISLNEFNANYRSKCITALDIKNQFVNDCGLIGDTLARTNEQNEGFITYFVIEGNTVTVYDKSIGGSNYVEPAPTISTEEIRLLGESLEETIRRLNLRSQNGN